LGKVIQKNQLDATMIWSIRSAQHVSGNLLPITRSVRLRFLQHMVSCCGGQGAAVWHYVYCKYSTQSATNLSLMLLMMGKISSINHCCI